MIRSQHEVERVSSSNWDRIIAEVTRTEQSIRCVVPTVFSKCWNHFGSQFVFESFCTSLCMNCVTAIRILCTFSLTMHNYFILLVPIFLQEFPLAQYFVGYTYFCFAFDVKV